MDGHRTNLFTFCMFDIFLYFIFIILQNWHLRGIKILFTCFFSQKLLDFRDHPSSPHQVSGPMYPCLLQVDTVRSHCSRVSCYKSSPLRRPVPIFRIPCIPPGYKAPIVFPWLAPQGKFSITFSLTWIFFFPLRKGTIRSEQNLKKWGHA